MGGITSICCKSENEVQIEKLQCDVTRQKKQISNAQEEIFHQKWVIRNHIRQSKQYESDINQYEIKATKLDKYESTIQDSDTLASHILSTELNCKWMNNEKEKEYLKSIFDYITVAMSDKSFQLSNLDTGVVEMIDSDSKLLT
jgi:hypothetical protein